MRRARKGEARSFLIAASQYAGSDCVIWPFAQADNGYGTAFYAGRSRVVSRVICEMVHGAPDNNEIEAAHSCGNRLCCTPSHLRWATPKENFADRYIHGTDQSGARNHQAKINEDIVREILKQPQLSQRALGKKYRIDPSVVCRIRRGKTWVAEARP